MDLELVVVSVPALVVALAEEVVVDLVEVGLVLVVVLVGVTDLRL